MMTPGARMREILDKGSPTPGEWREYLILDGRQGVREGQWSKEAFEKYTGTKFPE